MKPLTKVWRCPTCNFGFKASEAREDGKIGRRCPAGHFHSYYELKRHEDGKPLRAAAPRTIEAAPFGKAIGPSKLPPSKGERDYYLALLWIGAVDSLMAQLPEGSVVRAMVEGKLCQAYRVSKRIVDPAEIEAEERRAA